MLLGAAMLDTMAISNRVCFITVRYRATLRGLHVDSATHF